MVNKITKNTEKGTLYHHYHTIMPPILQGLISIKPIITQSVFIKHLMILILYKKIAYSCLAKYQKRTPYGKLQPRGVRKQCLRNLSPYLRQGISAFSSPNLRHGISAFFVSRLTLFSQASK